MANRVTAKTLGQTGSSRRGGGRVVYHIDTAETLDSDDFTFSYNVKNIYANSQNPLGSDSEEVTVVHVVIPRIIESVINMGPNTITIDGNVFETGRWELSQHGGISVEQAKGNIVITGTAPNALIEFRS